MSSNSNASDPNASSSAAPRQNPIVVSGPLPPRPSNIWELPTRLGERQRDPWPKTRTVLTTHTDGRSFLHPSGTWISIPFPPPSPPPPSSPSTSTRGGERAYCVTLEHRAVTSPSNPQVDYVLPLEMRVYALASQGGGWRDVALNPQDQRLVPSRGRSSRGEGGGGGGETHIEFRRPKEQSDEAEEWVRDEVREQEVLEQSERTLARGWEDAIRARGAAELAASRALKRLDRRRRAAAAREASSTRGST